jgi:two-component sensor histidine kinase
MTDNVLLNGVILGVSFINLILMSWLGLTVLLNTRQRTRGVWLSGVGLLAGALFFLCHTVILGFAPQFQTPALNIWWQAGWLPLVILPMNWYLVTGWYAGMWPDEIRWPRQRSLLLFVLLAGLGLLSWEILGQPLPTFAQALRADFSAAGPFLLAFAVYTILCTGLAAVSLRRMPAAAEPRRQQARPWLVAATNSLLVISSLVAGAIGWAILRNPVIAPTGRLNGLIAIAAGLDLLIASLITVVVILLGQAIVSFEVFTEQEIPRREFQRQWHNTIVLAIGLGSVAGFGLALAAPPVYLLLTVIMIVVLFFALSYWRSHHWRAQYLHQFRPLVASQHLYDQLTTDAPAAFDPAPPFTTLCRDVLRTGFAQLTPLGPLAPLVPLLCYPSGAPTIELPPHLPSHFRAPTDPGFRLTSDRWAIPLWSERGLIGVLLLGPKLNRNLYTQEELEIAQASAERLVDTRASAEIARRLLALQRQRLVESQLLDRQTRRVIHDDVLPELHAALLLLGSSDAHNDAVQALSSAHRQLADLLRSLPPVTLPNLEKLGVMGALRRVIENELSGAFDHVAWQTPPDSEITAGKLSSLQAGILFYAAREVLRNAAQHARGQAANRRLSLSITATGDSELSLCIEDDGVGLGQAASGNTGQGLALHSTMLAVVGGTMQLQSETGQFTRVTLTSGPINSVWKENNNA